MEVEPFPLVHVAAPFVDGHHGAIQHAFRAVAQMPNLEEECLQVEYKFQQYLQKASHVLREFFLSPRHMEEDFMQLRATQRAP